MPLIFILYVILSIIIYLITKRSYDKRLRQQAEKYRQDLDALHKQNEAEFAKRQEEYTKQLDQQFESAKRQQDIELQQRQKQLDSQFKLDAKDNQLKLIALSKEVDLKKQELSDARKQLQDEANSAKDQYDNYLQTFYKARQQYYEACYEQQCKDEQSFILNEIENATNEAIQKHNLKIKELTESYAQQQNCLEELKSTVQQFSATVHAINEANASAEKAAADKDFYRICLSAEVKADVALLQKTKSMLNNYILIDKLIYDCYIAKPLLEMTRRVLNGEKPCGVYKITNINTNKIYIGQSTDIANRWSGHIKSAFGLDGVADSIFQRALKADGIDNFTFEVIEKCDKSELRERERFWIGFYESNIYGYNMRSEVNPEQGQVKK